MAAFLGISIVVLLAIALIKLSKYHSDEPVISSELVDLLKRMNSSPNKGLRTVWFNRFKEQMKELYDLEYGTDYVLAEDCDGEIDLSLLSVNARHIIGGPLTSIYAFEEFFNDKICKYL